MMNINILGSSWKIEKHELDDPRLKDCSGYTDWTSRLIVIANLKKPEDTNLDDLNIFMKKVLRHEIVHAFLLESGLDECAYNTSCGWATNEEMVDWIARQGPKIVEAWKAADCL